MSMQIINQDPIRYLLEQTVKKGFFSKKEVIKYAIGDENGQPLTEWLGSYLSLRGWHLHGAETSAGD